MYNELMDKAQAYNRQRILRELLKQYNFNLKAAQADLELVYKNLKVSDMSDLNFKTSAWVKPDGEALIQVQDLSKIYKDGREKLIAVNRVNLEIWPGEIVALTGTSGSGKSTLLHMLGGLDKPSSGSIVVDGQEIAKLSDRKLSIFRNQTIGFVFQFFYMQPFLTLAENIAVPSLVRKMSAHARKERVFELAKQVGLADRLKHLPKELSGGQMQRAAIARALFNAPKIILADEPTGNLDSANSQAVIDLFKQIRRDFKTTIIIVTHDRALAAQADREIRMKDGEVL